MTASRDYTVRAGNTGTVQNERGIVVRVLVGPKGSEQPLDLTGQTIIFRAMKDGAEVLRKTSADGITVDLPTAEVVVPITLADSRTLEAAGQGITYDLERRATGLQRTILYGNLFVEPGANDDV